MLRGLTVVNSPKNDKSAGRDLKKIFLPNKKYYSVISDGIRNFLAGGSVDFPKFTYRLILSYWSP